MKRIEEEFYESWDKIQTLYTTWLRDKSYDFIRHILPLIEGLRERGYDKQFRAGQTLTHLILSKSQAHGLRRGQDHIEIIPQENGVFEVKYYGNNSHYVDDGIKDIVSKTPLEDAQILEMLERLKNQPID